MNILLVALLFAQMQQATPVLDNEFVQVFRDSAPCAAGSPACGDRVFVALGPVALSGKKMERGDIQVFTAGERYSPPSNGEYFEVAIKQGHPKASTPPAGSPPAAKNKVLYSGNSFTVFEENMQPGEISAPHSHNQRVAIFLNGTQVQQTSDGKTAILDERADGVFLRPAVVHISKDVGSVPIRNILIEFKP